MQVSDDVMELVQLLNEENFGVLAGELLIEISRGREIEDPDDDEVEASPQPSGEDWFTESEKMDLREPIPEDEQLDVALKFLESRLVGSMRHWAKAEAIAGCLASSPEADAEVNLGDDLDHQSAIDPDDRGEPIRIVFRPSPDLPGEVFLRSESPGSTRWADALATALGRLRTGAV
jgi:hypothetical protein